MKVLLANKFFFRNGGSESVFFDERAFLISNGVSVCDFSMEDDRNLPSATSNFFVSNKTYRSRTRPLASLAKGLSLIHSFEAVAKFRSLLDAERPEVVHCHNIYHQLTPSIIGVAKSRGIPVVLTLHDYKPVCPTYLRLRDGRPCSACVNGDFINVVKHRCADGSLGKSALLYVEATLQRIAKNYEKVDLIIAPSRFVASSVSGRFGTDRIRVLPNGIDTNRVQPSDVDGGYALYIGRLSKEKGIETLLAAHRRATTPFPLKVCGTGPMEPELRASYPEVEFLGYRSGDDLARVIAAASVVVVPSEWYENCPMSVLEAMAFGKAVVASKIGGIPELIVHGETGLLFEAGDAEQLANALCKLMNAPSERSKFGRAARARLEKAFSLAKHNHDLFAIYQDVIGSVATGN